MAKPKPKAKKKKAPKPKLATGFHFNAKNEIAQKVARKLSATLVTNITKKGREALRILVHRAIREGIPPLELARLISGVLPKEGMVTNAMPGMVGLTNQQIHAGLNYRASLIDMGHSAARVEKLMGAWVTRKLKERALSIARTETTAALRLGAELGWMQAQKEGYLQTNDKYVREVWITTKDEKLCPVCRPMHGRTKAIGTDTNFQSPDGPIAGPPMHTRCRCRVALVFAKMVDGEPRTASEVAEAEFHEEVAAE
jgi:hypothetical protein